MELPVRSCDLNDLHWRPFPEGWWRFDRRIEELQDIFTKIYLLGEDGVPGRPRSSFVTEVSQSALRLWYIARFYPGHARLGPGGQDTTSASFQNDENGLDSTWRCAMCRRRHAHGLPLSLAVWVKFLGASVKWVARVLRLPSIAKRNRRADRGPRAMGRSHDGRLVKRRPSAAALGGTLRRR